ncbi:hypothetical protein Bca101_020675 [Brassica carinata]
MSLEIVFSTWNKRGSSYQSGARGDGEGGGGASGRAAKAATQSHSANPPERSTRIYSRSNPRFTAKRRLLLRFGSPRPRHLSREAEDTHSLREDEAKRKRRKRSLRGWRLRAMTKRGGDRRVETLRRPPERETVRLCRGGAVDGERR